MNSSTTDYWSVASGIWKAEKPSIDQRKSNIHRALQPNLDVEKFSQVAYQQSEVSEWVNEVN